MDGARHYQRPGAIPPPPDVRPSSEHPPNRPTPDSGPEGGYGIRKPESGAGGKSGQTAQRLRGKGFLVAYKLCRRSGLAPWCSARLAVQYVGRA